MTEFDIKKGWYKNIDGDGLEGIMREVFGQVEKQGDVFVSSYGAMKRIEAKVISRNRLGVLTANVDDEVIRSYIDTVLPGKPDEAVLLDPGEADAPASAASNPDLW